MGDRRSAHPSRDRAEPQPFELRRGDRRYPELLARINDPPALLWVRGELPPPPAIAVVGSRECTAYGRRTAHRIGVELAHAGIAVVSGLARGIDAAAHEGALDGGGRTVAVLPCGIDRVYPPRHRTLAARISANGALVTEFEPGTTVTRWSFPQRNRIIAGLGILTIVVEAASRSGALMTAGLAEGYHRDVLAVPGPVDAPTSRGTNRRLSEGVHVCTGIESILGHLEPGVQQAARARLEARNATASVTVDELDAPARAVLDALPPSGGCRVDSLAHATGFPIGTLLAILTDIEVRGLIRSVGSQRYERVASSPPQH